jgi:hypothetical protein
VILVQIAAAMAGFLREEIRAEIVRESKSIEEEEEEERR